ncbi:organic cation transporter protein-like [Amphibalanus amphitrite]|uniref:organic cation transporter protein-like n=1 Tax=Amphibalanus amphitrite TaxID=1232801 RepID=UPI001C8FEF92|nr:organic cation transporter protein-like [Amphibalanus amphitrite]
MSYPAKDDPGEDLEKPQRSGDGPDAEKPQTKQPSEETFDDLLDLAGGGGRFQVLLVFATSLGALTAAIDTFCIVFKIDSPDHWCVRDAANNSLSCVPTEAGCEAESCFVPGSNATDGPRPACVQWQFDHSVYQSTVVTDFDLVCGRAVLRSMIFTAQMLTSLVTSLLFGLIGDWYGRARAAALAAGLFVLMASVTAATSNYNVFLSVASLTTGARMGIYICLFTLCMESVGERHRSVAGLVWVLPWAAGIMLTAAAGWLLRSWWQLQLVCAAAGLLLLPGVWLLPESPRWLAAHGRTERAAAGLRQIAAVNGRALPADVAERLRRLSLAPPAEDASRCREALLLFSSRRMCCLSLATIWLWMVMAVVYYGISFDSAQLADNAYLAMLLSGLVEVPSMAAVPLIDRLGRRPVMAATFLLTGAAILPVPAVPPGWPVLLLGMLGKLAIGAGFGVIYVHLEEYMPTEVRNAALGLSTMAESVGGALSPHVAYGLGGWHWAAPSVVFGVLAVSAGLVTLLVLPETAGRPLPETVRDVQKTR